MAGWGVDWMITVEGEDFGSYLSRSWQVQLSGYLRDGSYYFKNVLIPKACGEAALTMARQLAAEGKTSAEIGQRLYDAGLFPPPVTKVAQ